MDYIDSIIQQAEEVPAESSLTLADGTVFRFRTIKDGSEMRRIQGEGAELWDTFNKNLVPPELLAVKPTDREIALKGFWLHRVCIEPGITLWQVYKLAKVSWPTFFALTAAADPELPNFTVAQAASEPGEEAETPAETEQVEQAVAA